MRTSKEMAGEVWRRVEILEHHKTAAQRKIYSALAVAVCLVLVIGLSLAMPYLPANNPTAASGQYTATMFSDGTAGGYVLVAVIAFVLGAAVTLFCVKFLAKK